MRRTSHAVYEAKYHIVWCPKYRKKILVGAVRERVEEIFFEIGNQFEIEMEKIAIAEDHVHLLVSFPPRYSISKVVGIIKSISSSKIFDEFPKIKEKLWGGHIWEQGYFVRTIGEQVTDDVIKNYIDHHSQSFDQLTMF